MYFLGHMRQKQLRVVVFKYVLNFPLELDLGLETITVQSQLMQVHK
jgi:hypothetical protein